MSEPNYRFSGHQTFALRIAWIPKVVEAISRGEDPLTDPDVGIVSLGLGKNMVEALKTWVGAYQVAFKENNQWELTAIADLIFGAGNLDPCLDDITSAWVLHWQISTNRIAPFWAWECLFNRWPATEFTASEVLSRFREKADESPRPASTITLKQHWEVFLHTYQPPRLTRGDGAHRADHDYGRRAHGTSAPNALRSPHRPGRDLPSRP